MRELVKRYVEAGLGALGSERAEDLARDLIEWSRRNGERVVELVRREVQRQLRLVGVATRDELSELKKRVRTLERQAGKPPPRRPSAKKAAAKKSGARRSSSRSPG